MERTDDVTLIVPDYDLETNAIIDLAKRVGFSDERLIVPRGLPRGSRLDDVPAELLRRIETGKVWIVELPGPEKER